MTNRLDYSLLYSASKELVAYAQFVQNAAAKLVTNVGKHSHIAPTVPLETMGPFARGKTSSLPNVVAANSPRWDKNRNRGKDEATESHGE